MPAKYFSTTSFNNLFCKAYTAAKILQGHITSRTRHMIPHFRSEHKCAIDTTYAIAFSTSPIPKTSRNASGVSTMICAPLASKKAFVRNPHDTEIPLHFAFTAV